MLDVRPLIDDLADEAAGGGRPARARRRAAARRSRSPPTAPSPSIIVFFDERAIDDVRAEVLDAHPRRSSTRGCPTDFRAYYNGSLEISETYNRITLDNQTKFTPPILLLTLLAHLRDVPIVAVHAADDRRGARQRRSGRSALYDLLGFTYNVLSSMIVPLVVVLAIADDVHIIQHYGEERRAGPRRAGVQAHGVASGRAAPRRQRHDGARHGVAGDEPAWWPCASSASARPSA